MADILIKNLELPRTLTIYPNGDIDELIDGKYVTIGKAIELAPHGRLIDADRLKGIIRKANEDCMFVGKYERAKQWSDAEFYVDHAPTVLEANYGSDS